MGQLLKIYSNWNRDLKLFTNNRALMYWGFPDWGILDLRIPDPLTWELSSLYVKHTCAYLFSLPPWVCFHILHAIFSLFLFTLHNYYFVCLFLLFTYHWLYIWFSLFAGRKSSISKPSLVAKRQNCSKCFSASEVLWH